MRIELAHLESRLRIVGPHFKLWALGQWRAKRNMPGRHPVAALDDYSQRSTDEFFTPGCHKPCELLHHAFVAGSPLYRM